MAKEEKEVMEQEQTYSMSVFDDSEYNEDMQELFDNIEPLNEENDGDEESSQTESKETIAEPSGVENVGKEKDAEKASPEKPEEEISSSATNDKLYSSFAKSLKEKGGVFSHLSIEDKEIKSLDDLQAAIEESIKTNIDNSLSDVQKEFNEAMDIGMPKDEFKQLQGTIRQLEDIPEDALLGKEEDNVKLRYNIIKQNAMLQGIKEDKAEKLANVALKDNSDVEEARIALKEMREHYQNLYTDKKKEYEQNSKDAEKEYKNSLQSYTEKVNSLEKIGDFELTEDIKKKIVDNTTRIVDKKDGRPLNTLMKARLDNPDDFDIKLNWMWVMTNGFKDFNFFKGKGKKEATSEFESLLKQSSNSLGFNGTEDESFSLDDIDDTESIF